MSPENYDEELGAEICLEKIRDKVWFLLASFSRRRCMGSKGEVTPCESLFLSL